MTNELVARIRVGDQRTSDIDPTTGTYRTIGYELDGPRFIAPTTDQARAYVTLSASGQVALIDTLLLRQVDIEPKISDTDRGPIQQIDLRKVFPDAAPFAITLDAKNHYAYVTDQFSPRIYVIDINIESSRYNQLVHTITLTPELAPFGLRGAVTTSFDDKQFLLVTAPGQTLIGPGSNGNAKSHILVYDINAPEQSVSRGNFARSQTIELPQSGALASRDPYSLAVATNPKLVAFTNRASDATGLGVLSYEEGHWTYAFANDLFLGSAKDSFDVNDAQAVVLTSDMQYAFVAGYNKFVPGKLDRDPAAEPFNPAGSNIGIIRDPFGLYDTSNDLVGRGLVAATRMIPGGFIDNLAISPSGEFLYASYRGTNMVMVYSVGELRSQLELHIDKHNATYANIPETQRPNFIGLRFPINDMTIDANGNRQLAANQAIDVRADYRLSNVVGGLYPVFHTPDAARGPIAVGSSPRGLAAQDNFIQLLEPDSGTVRRSYADLPLVTQWP